MSILRRLIKFIKAKLSERIEVVGNTAPRVDHETFAKALGAKRMTDKELAEFRKKHGWPE